MTFDKADKEKSYIVTKRILQGKKLIGYELQSEDNEIIHVSKNDALNLLTQCCILNAYLNSANDSLGGRSEDFRKLPIITVR